jgi:ubiquinone/menaquinone biosynthesis C-methylase UbiE
MLEFTGERVVPGQVDIDLWNEHLARYLFAARLARRRRVLDIGCGAGYGSSELAHAAAAVTGLDLAPEAVALARSSYAAPNLQYLAASATSIPFADASFGLIVCFEVIEHVHDWHLLLTEARRLLAPGGQFIVSTPNKLYYAESRAQIGPNPFHVHEFEYDEFKAELESVFPSVTLYVQNHVGALSFQPTAAPASQVPQSAELHLQASQPDTASAHFYLAVCAATPQTGAPAFLHVPATSNLLRERESHIHKLEHELSLKDAWLQDLQRDHSTLLDAHRAQAAELESAQEWAKASHGEFETARKELLDACERYEQRLADMERTYAGHLEELNRRIELTQTERNSALAEAAHLHAEAERLRQVLTLARESRWVKLGRRINVGPDLQGV